MNHGDSTLLLEIKIFGDNSKPNYWGISDFNITLLTCHESCQTCADSLDDGCLTCPLGFRKQTTSLPMSKCVKDCMMFPDCDECDLSRCLKCKIGYFIDKQNNGMCYRSCPLGFFSFDLYSTNGLPSLLKSNQLLQ